MESFFPPFLPAAKPSGPRTVRVVVVVGGGGGVVGGSSLSGHNIVTNMKLTTKLQLHKFTSGWDPQLAVMNMPVSFCLTSALRFHFFSGIQIEQFPFFLLENSFDIES